LLLLRQGALDRLLQLLQVAPHVAQLAVLHAQLLLLLLLLGC
jgi:hypothetical protein